MNPSLPSSFAALRMSDFEGVSDGFSCIGVGAFRTPVTGPPNSFRRFSRLRRSAGVRAMSAHLHHESHL